MKVILIIKNKFIFNKYFKVEIKYHFKFMNK